MNNKPAQTALLGSFLLLVAVFALNILLSSGLSGFRLDLTEDKLYSLSDGVGPLLQELDEPVRLDFYYSQKSAENLPNFRTYAQRVQEFLEEMVQASNGTLSLRVLDPEPFSEAEDLARAAQLSRIQIDGVGQELTLGLVAVNSVDEQSVIPYLDPTQERFLEYEVMRSVISIGRLGRPTIGLVTSLDMAPSLDQQSMQMSPGWQILSQVEQLFDVVLIAESDTKLPEDLDLLWIVHPRSISPELAVAIDTYVLQEKPLILCLDPWCEADAQASDPAFGMQGPQPTSSQFDDFLGAWGLNWSRGYFVADRDLALRVQAMTDRGVEVMDFIAWWNARRENLNRDDPITKGLTTLNLATAGAFSIEEDASTRLVPVVRSSENSQRMLTAQLGFQIDPGTLIQNFESSGEPQIVAARYTGPIKSAYPPVIAEVSVDPALEEILDSSSEAPNGVANILVLGDVDFLSDSNWIREERLGAISLGYRTFADNGSFILNAIETMAGDPVLAGLRGRGEYTRPFGRVEVLRQAAEGEYLAEQEQLEAEIQETERRLGQLQQAQTGNQATLLLSPEQEMEVDQLQDKITAARKQLRLVQLNLRTDIEQLGTNLMLFNTIVWPLAVAAISGLIFLMRRKVS